MLTKQNKTDLLEIAIIFSMFFLVVVIYVPVAIWEKEEFYEKESRNRMQNIYDIETFYSQLTGDYNLNYLEALSVVNAARDSTVADSLFFGEQKIALFGKEFLVDINESFNFEYDTTFGIKSFRKDTINDTTLQIAVYSKDLGRNDTSFIRKRDLSLYNQTEDFIGVVNEEPLKRIEAVEFYKTNIPDSTTFYCPLSKKPYYLEINEEGSQLSVSSPIDEPIVEPRYLIFAFRAGSHGVIQGGRRSWD
jgi:hypothetical protein